MTSGPKLLLISDSPSSPTGLGGQCRLVYEAAVAAGFQVVVANLVIMPHEFPPRFFHASGMIPEYLVDVPLPPDHLGYILEDFRPDYVVALCDSWMLGAYLRMPLELLRRTIYWTTADHEFYPEVFDPLYHNVNTLVFMAEFGAKWWGETAKLKARRDKAGLRTTTIYHAVDGSLFKPRDKRMFRAAQLALGTEGHFIALHVGRNQQRKQQPLLIEGWARFVQSLSPGDRKLCTLYLHTEEHLPPSIQPHPDPVINAQAVMFSGLNLPRFIQKNYAPEVVQTIRFSERGGPKEAVAEMMSLADVHVLTSTGEGFGVPLIEAQASGRANIAADNTTTPEIVGGAQGVVMPSGRVAIAEGEDSNSFDGVPFGWRVPCNSFTVQPDCNAKRPQVDTVKLASALGEAHAFWQRGVLNQPTAVSRRRNWTLARYGWGKIRQQWIDLLKQVRGGA